MAPISLIARFQRWMHPPALRSYFVEFLSTFFYVLAVVGSAMASRKASSNTIENQVELFTVAVANALALSSAVYNSWNVSGGHLNPAITFGMTVRGRIEVSTALFYWMCQMIGAVMACLVLKVIVVEQHVPTYKIADEMTGFGATILEGVLTFGLAYTFFAAADPCQGVLGAAGPISIGFVAGANVLAGRPFSGGSMNPACAFGSAALGGSFKNQAVYWIGPLMGAAAAGLTYDNVVSSSSRQSEDPGETPVSAIRI